MFDSSLSQCIFYVRNTEVYCKCYLVCKLNVNVDVYLLEFNDFYFLVIYVVPRKLIKKK